MIGLEMFFMAANETKEKKGLAMVIERKQISQDWHIMTRWELPLFSFHCHSKIFTFRAYSNKIVPDRFSFLLKSVLRACKNKAEKQSDPLHFLQVPLTDISFLAHACVLQTWRSKSRKQSCRTPAQRIGFSRITMEQCSA